VKRTLMISVAALGLAAAGLSSSGTINPFSAPSAAAQGASMLQQSVFAIENMTCALCPVTVRKAIEGVPGVKSVAVDFDAKTATVLFDPSKATIAAIAQASTSAGYPARAKKG
jgi:mercuric ion binding protein